MLKESKRKTPVFQFEDQAHQQGYHLIIGVDEAGRGPLAGPVVSSAVALRSREFIHEINDSKKLTPSQRLRAYHEIFEKAYVGLGIICETVIDQQNILEATFYAMSNAVRDLISKIPSGAQGPLKDNTVKLLIDGNRFKSDLSYPAEMIIKGDEVCFSIACASIIAKVTRDRILEHYDKIFPEYGFKKHKGYGTKLHREAISQFGLTCIHRVTFCHSS